MIRTQNKKKIPKEKGETFTLPSLTVPDQTLSIRKILDRYAKGQPFSAPTREPIYNEDYDYDNLNHYDLTEIDDMVAEQLDLQDQANEKLSQLKKRKEDLINEEAQKAIEKQTKIE